jgi:capsular polysaccharide biosynthesis protein
MSSRIPFVLPLNYTAEWKAFFKEDRKHERVKLGIRSLKNVFVTQEGMVLKNGIPVWGCAPNMGFSMYDESAILGHWKLALEQWIVSSRGKSLPLRKLPSDKTFALIHSPWFSYYFWLTEALPRLLMLRPYFSQIVLLRPRIWDTFPFVKETLDLFPQLQVEIIEDSEHCWIPELLLPETKPWSPMFLKRPLFEVREFLFESWKLNLAQTTPPIYISRKQAKRRRFQNEDRVEGFFDSQGFEVVCMEELPFREQVQRICTARGIAGITGAGLINTMFLPNGSFLWDLSNSQYKTTSRYKFHFFKLCNMLGLNYGLTFFNPVQTPGADHYTSNNLQEDIGLMQREWKKMF